MARDRLRRGWRPNPKQSFGLAPRVFGVWSACLFNLCLFALPLAGAIALILIVRDDLYTYPLTQSSAREARAHVERISSNLIQLDFDRRGQWDDLIAMELMDRDISAARGFLLSGRTMLSGRDARTIAQAAHSDDDAAVELASLDLVTPGTRARYESTVPLLSRYADQDAARRAGMAPAPEDLGDARDFELLTETALTDASDDASRLTLTGLGLGLGETLTPRQRDGAIALIAAMRRPDFSTDMYDAVKNLLASVLPPERFRQEAQARAVAQQNAQIAAQQAAARAPRAARSAARGESPSAPDAPAQSPTGGSAASAYPVSAPAFRAVFNQAAWAPLRDTLDDIGAMSEATSPNGAALILSHAQSSRDVPRLRLVTVAGRDRTVAAAKRAPRDGRLAAAAPGSLRFSPGLTAALSVGAIAGLGLLWCLIALTWISVSPLVLRYFGKRDKGEEDDRHHLVTHFNAPWRVL